MNHASSAERLLWQVKHEAGWWIFSLARAPLCNSFLIQGGKTEASPLTSILLGVYRKIDLNNFFSLQMLCTPQKSRKNHWSFHMCMSVYVPWNFSLPCLWLGWIKVLICISQVKGKWFGYSSMGFVRVALASCSHHNLYVEQTDQSSGPRWNFNVSIQKY